jgi:hypothetical protein
MATDTAQRRHNIWLIIIIIILGLVLLLNLIERVRQEPSATSSSSASSLVLMDEQLRLMKQIQASNTQMIGLLQEIDTGRSADPGTAVQALADLDAGQQRLLSAIEAIKQDLSLLAAAQPQGKQQRDDQATGSTDDTDAETMARQQEAEILSLIEKGELGRAGVLLAETSGQMPQQITTALQTRWEEAVLLADLRRIPARNTYLNMLLYQRLERINPGIARYADKAAQYQARYLETTGHDNISDPCYDQGYLYGRCIARGLQNRLCPWERPQAIITSPCTNHQETLKGLSAGIQAE